MMGQRDSQAMS